MSNAQQTEHPPDICLLLRVHGEHRWLASRVVPVLRQLEEPGAIASDEQGVALAYLEVLWLEAGLHAAETDAAAAKIEPADERSRSLLADRTSRYYALVRRLRQAVDRRVRALTAPPRAQLEHSPLEATGL